LLERYGLSRQAEKGVWGSGSQCLQYLGFVIDTRKGVFEVPAKKLDAVSEMAHKLLGRARMNRRVIPTDKLESLIGKCQSLRLAVPDTAFRLRALYDCVPKRKQGHGIALGSIGRRYQEIVMTRLSHAALRDLQFWKNLSKQLHYRPIWPTELAPTCTVYTDASMTAYGATLSRGAHSAGTRGWYETRGFWEGTHREVAHIAMLELTTVRLALRAFLDHCVLRESEIIRLYTDNQVVMRTVRAWVSKSPALMAELRRLHRLCRRHGLILDIHHLPPALNLYADRLSRRRRVVDYLPTLQGFPDHWWVGDTTSSIGYMSSC
jgi:hypothetical protein